ncbi:MAG: elongation factor Ts [Geminicoccaceae bacterium]|nr:MAG: elongation factor Ts [Geminicoccaceae bacterium]
MPAITAQLVKELREKTGAGMMDCKKALEETEGDVEAASDWLRKKGLAAAAKKAGRATAEGLVAVVVDGPMGVLVEVNSETDFVARNEAFQAMVKTIAEAAPAAKGDVEVLQGLTLPTGRTVADEIANAIGIIGENMGLRRTAMLTVDPGAVGGYVHAQSAPGLGKIGVLVGLQSSASDQNALGELARQLAMHVAAANPSAVTVAALDPAQVEREKAIFTDQALASGKPANIVEKMVEGRLRKYYEDVVLLEQVYVIDTDKKVKDVVEAAGKALGAPIEVAGFIKFVLGEGIEREATDLAAEVAQLAGN